MPHYQRTILGIQLFRSVAGYTVMPPTGKAGKAIRWVKKVESNPCKWQWKHCVSGATGWTCTLRDGVRELKDRLDHQ